MNIIDFVISPTFSPEKLPGSALTDQELEERFESLTGRKVISMQKSNVITLTLYIYSISLYIRVYKGYVL